MRATAELTYGATGQKLTLAVQRDVPTAGTFKAFHSYASDDSTPEFSGTATMDTVATTLSGVAGPTATDSQRIPLTSSAGVVVGRRYRVSENALSEWVEVIEVGTGYVRARHPVHSTFTAAATFAGATVTADVPDAWAADLAHVNDHADPEPGYRVQWSFTQPGGVTLIVYTSFDLVRGEVLPAVDIEDVNARAPGLNDGLPIEYRADQGRSLIAAAWRQVRLDIARAGLDVDAIRNEEVLDELVILRSLRVLAEGGWKPLAFDSLIAYIEVVRVNYDNFYNHHILGIAKAAAGTSGGTDAVALPPVWSK